MSKRSKKQDDIQVLPPKKQPPIICEAEQKAWNNRLHSDEVPISSAYPAIDNDLARDNIENDISQADLQDI